MRNLEDQIRAEFILGDESVEHRAQEIMRTHPSVSFRRSNPIVSPDIRSETIRKTMTDFSWSDPSVRSKVNKSDSTGCLMSECNWSESTEPAMMSESTNEMQAPLECVHSEVHEAHLLPTKPGVDLDIEPSGQTQAGGDKPSGQIQAGGDDDTTEPHLGAEPIVSNGSLIDALKNLDENEPLIRVTSPTLASRDDLIPNQDKQVEPEEIQDLGDIEDFLGYNDITEDKTIVWDGKEMGGDISSDELVTFKQGTFALKRGTFSCADLEDERVNFIKMDPVYGPNYSHGIEMILGDIFESTETLAHAISANISMHTGVAYDFRCEFGEVQNLFMQKVKPGGVAILKKEIERNGEMGRRFIYNLITKVRYEDTPTLGNLKSSLEAMRDHALEHGIRVICMPKIGVGFEQCKWADVYQIIDQVFKNTPIFIKVFVIPRNEHVRLIERELEEEYTGKEEDYIEYCWGRDPESMSTMNLRVIETMDYEFTHPDHKGDN
jgi:O-acetyl-ADP-ribose deacetylase (regulator of RNase III)